MDVVIWTTLKKKAAMGVVTWSWRGRQPWKGWLEEEGERRGGGCLGFLGLGMKNGRNGGVWVRGVPGRWVFWVG